VIRNLWRRVIGSRSLERHSSGSARRSARTPLAAAVVVNLARQRLMRQRCSMGWIPAWSSRLPGRLRLLCSHKTYSCLVRFVVIFASALSGAGSDAELCRQGWKSRVWTSRACSHRLKSASSAGDNQPAPEDSAAWRQEVAARLNRYQSRRKPRPPRYPSLRLAL